MFSLISAWANVWAYMSDLSRHRTHYDVTVMASLGHCEWTFFLLACGWRRNDCSAINFRAITPLHTPCGIYDTKFIKYASILSRNKPTGDFIFVRLCALNWMSLGRWIKCLKDILFIFCQRILRIFRVSLWNCSVSRVNTGSGNGVVPSGNTPLSEPLLTIIFGIIWRHYGDNALISRINTSDQTW